MEKAKQARSGGMLKIFFGYAPGVGKTYAMLQAARQVRARGVDVAVGCVESHGYPRTAELLEGDGCPLYAPVMGVMGRTVRESLCSVVRYRFWEGEALLFEHVDRCAGFEYAEPETL